MTFRKLLALTLAMVMVLALFAGCAKTDPDKGGDKPVTDTGKPEEKKVRTDIVIGESSDVVTTDPHDSTDMYSTLFNNFMYNGLVTFDDDINIKPALAESWETPSDTEYVFHLRKGVKFHNGEEMKAGDVVFSLKRMVGSPKIKARFGDIAEVALVDDYTVSIKTSAPSALLLLNLASPQSLILNEKAVTEAEASGKKYGETTPVGTGYMKFESWKPNDSFKVVRFDEYWGGKGETTSITSRVIPEPASRTIALETGEVDFLGAVPDIDVARIRENKDLAYVDMPGSVVTYLGMNTGKKPFDNVKVRQALSHAVNKKAIIDAVLEGNGSIALSPFATIIEGYTDGAPQYAYDVEKSKAMLVEAGFPDGFNTTVVCSSETNNKIAQMLQADFSAIGVTLDIMLLEWGAFLAYAQETNHEMFLVGWGNTVNADSTLTGQFHSSSTAASGNRAWYKNPELDQVIESARSEMDAAKRGELYAKAQTIVMENAVWIPLFQKTSMIGTAKGFTGAELTVTSTYHTFRNAVVEG